jgi:hypothetical protein
MCRNLYRFKCSNPRFVQQLRLPVTYAYNPFSHTPAYNISSVESVFSPARESFLQSIPILYIIEHMACIIVNRPSLCRGLLSESTTAAAAAVINTATPP